MFVFVYSLYVFLVIWPLIWTFKQDHHIYSCPEEDFTRSLFSCSIHDFQVSGPQNMNKVFKDDQNGEAEVTLSWTPELSDLYRSVPVCFTAETNET